MFEAQFQILERTPEILRAWLGGLPGEWLDQDEGPGTFSPRILLAHWIHGEVEDWIPRIAVLVDEGPEVTFARFDPNAYGEYLGSGDVGELLDRFAELRLACIAAFHSLVIGPDDHAKTAHHPALGAVTLHQLVSTWAAHDLAHLGQLARVMAGRFREDVGPWRQYLRILG